ncbi:Peptidase family M28 [Flexibacter flexilis DSM 6793]|uniref:Peptidase family M28 n=1 Tax=Flexibacter flexilis DSM 6793 TaxID=927664 RepID=A0A1I1DH90_9BACT|nr:M28 family peptidase [Flexibacter flexilis]SFB73742.1 Peptidase family M28 [Flexibacter flexilis DSM 6793]
MNKKYINLCAFALASVGWTNVFAQQTPDAVATKYANTITVADLTKHLTIIASDSLEGRETGEKGQKLAADYISKQFAAMGLAAPVNTPNGKSFYQKFNLERRSWGDCAIWIKGKKKEMLQDFFPMGNFNIPDTKTEEVMFVGYGIDSENYSDYLAISPTNHAVVIWGGEPAAADGTSSVTGKREPSEWANNWRKKVAAARERGARTCFIVPKHTNEEFLKMMIQYKHSIETPTLSLQGKPLEEEGVFFISPAMAAEMLGTTEAKLSKISETVSLDPVKRGRKKIEGIAVAINEVSFKAQRIIEPVGTENVLGYLEGTDKKDELLVVTAHYDHIGKEGNKVFNGADDDGSGTVAVMEIAEAFVKAKKEGKSPRRSILFMTVTGEEKGLLGSDYYTQNPVFPLKNTVANLNIDMIGRLDDAHKTNENYIYLIGSDKLSKELHQLSENANKTYTNLTLDYTYNDEKDPNRYYYRSDHYNFAKNNVPVIFYFNGVHEDYHKETDEISKILFGKMEKISRLVFYTAWQIANQPNRISLDVKPVKEEDSGKF